jgi:cation/acetate symporter
MQLNVNGISIGFFFAFMALTLFITYWAAKRTNTTEQFFAADGKITAWQNGWALAGDFLSSAALLGIAGVITASGFWNDLFDRVARRLADHVVSDC